MAIQFIDNQPLTFQDNFPTGGECLLGQQEYCTKYNKGDSILAQWKITPCNDANLICNPNFNNNQAEGVVDRTMSTGTFNWSASSNWSFDAINLRFKSTGTGAFNGTLSGNLNGNVLSSYACQVEFTIGGGSGGTITPDLGGNLGSAVYLPGTYRQTIVYGTTHNKIKFNTFNYDGWIDNVSVKYAILYSSLQDSCWASTDFPERWNVEVNGCISKKPGVADQISNFTYGYVANNYVKLSFNVSNLNNGTMSILNNGVVLLVVDQNGYYEKYFNINNASIVFSADASFDGTICDLSLISYEQDVHIDLVSLEGGPTYNFDSALSYYEDRLLFDRFINTGIQSGCYQLCLETTCPTLESINMSKDPDFVDGGYDYKDEHGAQTPGSLSSGYFTVDMDNTAGYNQFILTDNTVCLTGQTFYEINYSITTGSLFEGSTSISIFFPGCPSSTYVVTSAGTPNTIYSGTFILNCQPTSCGFGIRFYCADAKDGSRIELVQALVSYMQETNAFPVTYCSNCINIQQNHYCSLFIGATCGEDSFGFKFPDPWKLGARVKAVMINPKYNGELKRYADSEGRLIVTKANSNKIYQLLIDYVDERSHDWLRTAFLCDTIEIGDVFSSGDFFVGTDGDYEPEWPSNLGNFNLAQARVNLQRKTDVIYNNNAG